MSRNHSKHSRVIGIAPSAKGFGYAVFEGKETLVDWGISHVERNKTVLSLRKVEKLILRYRPDVLAIQDYWAKDSRRAIRIQDLGTRLRALAKNLDVRVILISRRKVDRVIVGHERATKYVLAQALAKLFPEELSSRLPPKRRPWTSEDNRMDIFDAVALALVVVRNTPLGKPLFSVHNDSPRV